MSGRKWAKEARLFELAGDISYDSDWYNGFELSGLERAVRCADSAIAKPARALAESARPERKLLLGYFEIFHDWELGAAWSDARGAGWNTDCSHNGLEGILAEARLREAEGDRDGADFAFYLAAKTACALIAAESLADYLLDVRFFRPMGASPCGFWDLPEGAAPIPPNSPFPPGNPTFGIESIYLARGGSIQSPSSKNPYALAGHFPEFNSLQRSYGRMPRYREIAGLWRKHFPQRYANWIAFLLRHA